MSGAGRLISLPGDGGFGFGDNQGTGPGRPEPPEKNPEDSVPSSESNALLSPVADSELLAQEGSRSHPQQN